MGSNLIFITSHAMQLGFGHSTSLDLSKSSEVYYEDEIMLKAFSSVQWQLALVSYLVL